MRGRRRGLGLGNYTLGDRYITPDRRLSQSLIQQGSRGGPSNSWQETMGRIAQQLAGAYIGYKDQQNRNVANQAFAKVEPDSYSMQPTMNDQQIMESDKVQNILRQNTDADRMSNPMIQRNMNAIGNEQDRIAEQEQILSDLQDTASRNRFTDGGELMQVQGPLTDKYYSGAIDRAKQNIENYGDEFNQTMGRLNSQEPTDDQRADAVRQELIGQRRASEVNTLNEKKPQLEYAMQNLRGLENNPYAQRLLQGLMMNKMSNDAASRLDAIARQRQLEDDARDRGYTVEDRDIRTGATAPKSQEISLPDGTTQRQIYVNGAWVNDGIPYDENLRSKAAQKQAIDRGQASKSYFDPEAYKKKETIKADAKGDSYSKKPMPASALKVQDDHIAAINTSKGLDADLGKWDEMITSGELDLGFFTNPLNKAKTYTGFGSDEQSRNYSSFRTSLEKMRNESLRLNKGIQTEGDAQRIWNELISNISDEEFVSLRLKELQAVNQRAVDIRKFQIESIRNNYGKGPLDEAPEPKAIPGSGGVDLVYVPGQGLVPEKRGQ